MAAKQASKNALEGLSAPSLQKLLRPGDEIVLAGQQVLVPVVDRCAAVGDVQFPEQLLEPLDQHLFPGETAFLQQFPVGDVDEVIAVQNGLRGFDARLPEGLGQSLGLPGGEIQNGVVQVQKNMFQHGALL